MVARLRANTSGSLDPFTVGGVEADGETLAGVPVGEGLAADGRETEVCVRPAASP